MRPAFTRARKPAEKAARRDQILAAARAYLDDTGDVAGLSLTALARAAGMAKSNVYRYFESREAVLLAVLEAEWEEWADDVLDGLAPLDPSTEAFAAHLARTAAARPVMCQLVAVMATVLEHNVSTETVAAFKGGSLTLLQSISTSLARARPSMSTAQYGELLHHAVPLMVGLWPFANPSDTVAEVLAAEELAPFRHDFERDLARVLLLLLRGIAQDAGG